MPRTPRIVSPALALAFTIVASFVWILVAGIGCASSSGEKAWVSACDPYPEVYFVWPNAILYLFEGQPVPMAAQLATLAAVDAAAILLIFRARSLVEPSIKRSLVALAVYLLVSAVGTFVMLFLWLWIALEGSL